MKTREQAEQRALEIYREKMAFSTEGVAMAARQGFLQCWEEMQKSNQKELLCEMMRKDEDSGVYETQDKVSIEKLKNDYLRGEYELDEFIERLKKAIK